ncbi:hypothetical protein FB451DRAFT_208028 [Mycena latifolia]|nr:hypothetical protein FB451DRAFT_208028 [Mycena latifolia]
MPRKRARDSDATEETFPVEAILSARRTKGLVVSDPDNPAFGSGWSYLIKWSGYGDDDSSWVPLSYLDGCERLLQSFWSEIGHECLLTTVSGFVASPRPEWIAQERDFFMNQSGMVLNYPGSPKKNRAPSCSSTNGSPRTPARQRSTSRTTTPRKIRLIPMRSPSSSSSSPLKRAKTTWTERPSTPPASPSDPIFSNSPLTPSLTPEHEPAAAVGTSTQAGVHELRLDTHEQSAAHGPMLATPDPTPDPFSASDAMLHTPTLVPDEAMPHPTTAKDVFLSFPARNEEDVSHNSMSIPMHLDTNFNYEELGDSLLRMPVDDILAQW